MNALSDLEYAVTILDENMKQILDVWEFADGNEEVIIDMINNAHYSTIVIGALISERQKEYKSDYAKEKEFNYSE